MDRIYHPYYIWEDYLGGMYNETTQDEMMIFDCVQLLSNPESFRVASLRLLTEWKMSTENNLSNTSCNRRAWIGAAACCITLGATEITVRKAWRLLTDMERYEANMIADKIIITYEGIHNKLYPTMGNGLYDRATRNSPRQA